MKRVGMREFLINTSKWMKEAPVVVTFRGADVHRVTNVTTKEEMPVNGENNVMMAKKILSGEFSGGVYGCGCNKEPSRNLCKKHGRV